MIVLDVLGAPRPQARPRVFRVAGHPRVLSEKTGWYWRVHMAALYARDGGEPCIEGPVRLLMEHRMPRPKRLAKKATPAHIIKPDWDNLGKVSDALVGVLLARDEQVVDGRVTKRYAEPGESPGCRITIEPLAELAALSGEARKAKGDS